MEVTFTLNTEYTSLIIISQAYPEINCACLGVLEMRDLISIYVYLTFSYFILNVKPEQIKQAACKNEKQTEN